METPRIEVPSLLNRRTLLVATVMIGAAMPPAMRPDGQTEPTAHPTRRLDVTRDTWVSEVGREADGNNGACASAQAQEYPGDDSA